MLHPLQYRPVGQVLAQVAQVHDPDGVPGGWMVWLTLQQGELFDRHLDADAAKTAAVAALDPDRPPGARRGR
jgi:hypothetical protein